MLYPLPFTLYPSRFMFANGPVRTPGPTDEIQHSTYYGYPIDGLLGTAGPTDSGPYGHAIHPVGTGLRPVRKINGLLGTPGPTDEIQHSTYYGYPIDGPGDSRPYRQWALQGCSRLCGQQILSPYCSLLTPYFLLLLRTVTLFSLFF